MNEAKIELLKKLKALAEQGVGGEKVNAQRMLDQLMKKYNISEEDLCEEKVQTFEFHWNNETEKRLLIQIIYKITNSVMIYTYFHHDINGKRRQTAYILGCDCTQSQRLEIEFLFEFYLRLWKKDLALFFHAFIQKHELFGNSEGTSDSKTDEDTLWKMSNLMRGMSDDTPTKLIEQGGKK